MLSLTKTTIIKKISNEEFNVREINRIPEEYPKLRQKSKTITFAAQYGGTYKTFINSGFNKKEAQEIEINYNKLYKESNDWLKNRLKNASKQGYVTVAFGLRVRTPILAQTILGKKTTPYEAASEGRTAGNATQQSYGLLNNRSAIEFHDRLMNSKYKYDIKPISHIHDAQYFLVREDLNILKWFNDNLVKCMQWQELPEIKHDKVKLGGSVEVYYPNWSTKFTLPNKASVEDIRQILKGKNK